MVLVLKIAPERASKTLFTPTPETIEQRGVVLAVGPDVKELAIGDNVIYLKYKESAVAEKSVLIKEEFIIAMLQP
jgi:NADPH:quinone reductase-like Zn-dependent oxidoreductase